MAKKSGAGTFALVLAGVAFAFTIYMAVSGNDRDDSCDAQYSSRVAEQIAEQNCNAQKEDKNLMLISGGVAVALLVFGLVRRYQPAQVDPSA